MPACCEKIGPITVNSARPFQARVNVTRKVEVEIIGQRNYLEKIVRPWTIKKIVKTGSLSAITKIERRLLCINRMRRRFATGKRTIFELTDTVKTASCRPYRSKNFRACRNSYARKPRTDYLDNLLSERAHRAFGLWRPSLFHHLSVSEKPEADAGRRHIILNNCRR